MRSYFRISRKSERLQIAEWSSLIEELLQKNPAPDKATEQLAWIQHMNMLKAQAEEIVAAELIYC